MSGTNVDPGTLDAGFSSTKKEILVALKRDKRVSLSDLSRTLGISKMAVLKHMTVLESKGFVERSFQASGRGRPSVYFQLTSSAVRLFPEAYAHMTLYALRFIENQLGRESVVRLLEQRAQEVYGANGGRFQDKDFRGKVEELVRLRDEAGYMAEQARVGRTSAEVLEHNCPIMAVAEVYGEACGVEQELFEKLLRADVDVSHRVVAGDPVCRFLIRKRGEFHG
ncbi:MAG TPA: metalloregulator ArsR/SmtB family transcription factor [Thermoplasmata archaeon]